MVAAAMPATCDPWPLTSSTVELELRFLLTTTLPWRSGCDTETPVSRTAILTVALPLFVVQASGALILLIPHWSEKLGSSGTSAASAVASGSANSTLAVCFSRARAVAAVADGTATT